MSGGLGEKSSWQDRQLNNFLSDDGYGMLTAGHGISSGQADEAVRP